MPLSYTLEIKKLELKFTWAISRNAADFKHNAYITITDGQFTGKGEAAPNTRYGEHPEDFLQLFSSLTFPEFVSVNHMSDWLLEHQVPNALRFGIESAFVHYLSHKNGQTVSAFLGIPAPVARATSYTIPIMQVKDLQQYFLKYRPERFEQIKIKVNSENMVDFVKEISRLCSNMLMIDANEAYQNPDHFLKDLQAIQDERLVLVEQPFPAGAHQEYRYLKQQITVPVFADESVTDQADFTLLSDCFHGVNVKLMKAGGYLNAIRLLNEARKYKMKTMVGCMIESGLGISSGFQLSPLADYLDLDSFMVLKEDLFPLIKEHDGILFWSDASLPA